MLCSLYGMYSEKPQLPSDFEAVTWLKLEDAIRAVHEKRAVSSSMEELYRVSPKGDQEAAGGLPVTVCLVQPHQVLFPVSHPEWTLQPRHRALTGLFSLSKLQG